MPTKRDSTYLLDGLTDNLSDIPRIHSTDTHGFSEPVFAFTALCGIEFCPRLKDIEDQIIYGSKSAKFYKDQDYKIYPSRAIKWRDIESQWNQILRLMASVLTGHSTASQIFNRLNSYSGDHPLYKALKELGRIEKSLFILRYQGNDALRERIQKQLNIGEQMNRFAKAVCWGDGQRLRGSSVMDFERASACTQLLQNAVILWNYLFVSQRLMAMDPETRGETVAQIARGQMMAWRHVNFTGTFQFTQRRQTNSGFDLDELSSLDIPWTNPSEKPDWPENLHGVA